MSGHSASLTCWKDKPFRLLDLPPELWSRICRLAVLDGAPSRILHLRGYVRRDDLKRQLQAPAITTVCHAIRTETLPLVRTEYIACDVRDVQCGCNIREWVGMLVRSGLEPSPRVFLCSIYDVAGFKGALPCLWGLRGIVHKEVDSHLRDEMKNVVCEVAWKR